MFFPTSGELEHKSHHSTGVLTYYCFWHRPPQKLMYLPGGEPTSLLRGPLPRSWAGDMEACRPSLWRQPQGPAGPMSMGIPSSLQYSARHATIFFLYKSWTFSVSFSETALISFPAQKSTGKRFEDEMCYVRRGKKTKQKFWDSGIE